MSASAGSSPSKSGWVQFGEDGGEGGDEGGGENGVQMQQHHGGSASAGNSPTKSVAGSSGAGSARGSVKSISQQHSRTATQDATLDVSDIQVVDERALRKKSSSANNGNTINSDSGAGASVSSSSSEFRRMSSSAVSRVSTVGGPHNVSTDSGMDNVNLNDESGGGPGSPAAASASEVPDGRARIMRGKHFQNGEVIVTLLPVNERFPWVTPAKFRPELVPEELMAPVLTLTVEEYVQTMEKLTTDMRFTVYNICYKRILIIWIATAFTILLCLLFSGFQGVQLFACGVIWLIMNASAIFFCMWVKLRLNKQLERCLASINQGLIKHKIILGVDDRGKLSCHKVNLCFIYFDPADCIKKLEAVLSEKPEEQQQQQNGATPSSASATPFDRETYLREVEQFEDVEVVVAGRAGVRIDRKSERAEKLYLHYLQRWAKDYLRRRLDWLVEDLYGRAEYSSNTNPRHLRSALCPCQYIEEHLRNKRQAESLNPCSLSANPCHWCS